MALSAITRRRRHIKRLLRRRNRFQFGQPARTTNKVGGGSYACTDTAIQLIVWVAKGRKVSLNKVRVASGGPQGSARYEPGMRGLYPSEALRALRRFGLEYEVRSDLSAADVMRIARNRGPVIIAEYYWSHPQWKGFRYAGRTLKGWALNNRGKRVKVGFARPLRRSGLTQWNFRGGHAVLLATSQQIDGESIGFVRDPNHNSRVRPERPAWDRVSVWQLNRMMNSIKPGYYGRRLIYVPKKVVVKV